MLELTGQELNHLQERHEGSREGPFNTLDLGVHRDVFTGVPLAFMDDAVLAPVAYPPTTAYRIHDKA